MEGLFRLKVTQEEMYDLGNIKNIDHYILYDSSSEVAVEITAEVNQAPLLSKVPPYKIIGDIDFFRKLVNGDVKGESIFPAGYEQEELIGDNYSKLRESMIVLRDFQKSLDEGIDNIRKLCLESRLVKPQED